jgi:hypothetical protein
MRALFHFTEYQGVPLYDWLGLSVTSFSGLWKHTAPLL